MKECSLLCVRWWPLALIGLPMLFMLPVLAAKWRFIEVDVANNTSANLHSIGANWANIETFNRGRHVLITGSPPSQADIDQAYAVAKSSKGVDEITISPDVKAPPEFAKLSASINGKVIELRGEVSSQSEIDSLVTNAKKAVGDGHVKNFLTIGRNTAPLPNTSNLFTLLANNSSGVTGLKANIAMNNLSLEGQANSPIAKSILESDLNERYKGQIITKLSIKSPPPIKRNICQELVNELLNNSEIRFETAKAIIKADSFELLNNIKSVAERCPKTSFEIAGHTDITGNLEFNMSLSQARAQAVLDHLVGLGLDDTQFRAIGYGPKQAIADNSTVEGRAQNRRIEFKLKN